MAEDLSKRLRALKHSTDELNALTDRANDLVRRTEIYLTEECRVGGPVHVHVPSLDAEVEPGGPEWSVSLGYDRYKGALRIIVTSLLDNEPRDVKPWAECSRDTKLESLTVLPNLIDEILKKITKQITDVRATVDLLDSIVPCAKDAPRDRPTSRKG